MRDERSAFQGMSIREIRGMPSTMDATLLQLGIIPRTEAPSIAREQEKYVLSVLNRCPPWRWIKRKRLAFAVAHAARVRELCEHARKP